MKKSGFTLVELIAVIAVLAVIMVLAFPAILSAREDILEGMSREQINNLKDAAKLLGVDLDDYMTEVYNCKSGSWIANENTSEVPYCIKNEDKWSEVKVNVEDLIEHEYFRDVKGICSGTLTITRASGGGSYKVDLDGNIECK